MARTDGSRAAAASDAPAVLDIAASCLGEIEFFAADVSSPVGTESRFGGTNAALICSISGRTAVRRASQKNQFYLGEAFSRFILEGIGLCTKLPIARRSTKALKRVSRFAPKLLRLSVLR